MSVTRSRRLRRSAAGAAVVLVSAALAAPALARPSLAAGDKLETVHVGVGQSFTKSYPAISGNDVVETVNFNNAASPSYETVAGCESDPGCVHIPVHLDVPAASVKNNLYVFKATLTWDPQVRQEGLAVVGNAYGDQMDALLYDNPNRKDNNKNDTATDYQVLEPAVVNDSSPLSAEIDLLVLNEHGANTGYSVKYELIDNKVQDYYPPGAVEYGKGTKKPTRATTPSSPGKVPLSTVAHPDAPGTVSTPVVTTTTTGASTAGGVITTTTETTSTAQNPAPDLAPAMVQVGANPGGTVDASLAGLIQPVGVPKLGLRDEAISGNTVAGPAAASGSVSWGLLVLAIALPLAAIAGWLVAAARRRRSQISRAAAAV